MQNGKVLAMVINDVGKLAGLATVTVGLFVLVAIGRIEWDVAAPVVTLVVGYLTGTGEAAVRRKAPSPVVVPRVAPGEVVTLHGPVTEADHRPGDGPDDAWPDPEEHRFFTDENGDP